MALSVIVKLLDGHGTAQIETRAQHWSADAVCRELKDVKWIDVSPNPGFSDYIADLDGATAMSLNEYFREDCLSWIALYEKLTGSYRSKGEIKQADDHAKVGEEYKAQLAALDEIVRRACAEGLKVRLLLEEWSSGY